MGSCELKQGLLKLGIGVSDEVANTLLQELGGRTHFTAHDLASFTQHVGDCKDTERSSARSTKASTGEKKFSSGPFPSQGASFVDEQKNKTVVRPRSHETEHEGLEPDITPPLQDDREQGVTHSSRLGRIDDNTMPPLGLCPRPRLIDHRTKRVWDDLPGWAREASKSALLELLGHHER